MSGIAARAGVLAAIGAALVAGVPRGPEVPWTPVEAAMRAATQLPTASLPWGRLRGWSRARGGWLLAWQPAHGAWLLRTFMPDGGAPARWRFDVAPWLPGPHLSAGASALLLDFPADPPIAEERLARRDWRFGGQRLAGALPVGGPLEVSAERSGGGPWQVALAGLLLAGVVARMVFPAVPVRLFRRIMSWSAAALLVASLWLTPLAASEFRVGVRPWVTQLVVGAVAVLVVGALVVAMMSVPAAYGAPAPRLLGLALAAGLLAGRLAPGAWAPAVEGLTARGPVLVGIVLVGGWLGGLAADGVRHILGGTARVRGVILTAVTVAAVATAGDALGPVLAVLVAAAVERPQGVWAAASTLWGWATGAVLASCAWPAAIVDAGLLLLAALVALTGLELSKRPIRPT